MNPPPPSTVGGRIACKPPPARPGRHEFTMPEEMKPITNQHRIPCLKPILALALALACPSFAQQPDVLLISDELLKGETTPRLTAGPEATLLLDGKPFRGIGVNYFDCFLRTLKNGGDTSYDAGFATLAAKGIPFARFCATGFWPLEMKLYQENRAEYFRRLDGVVKSAETHGIGLVPSLFWYYACVPDMVGEPMNQWANPQSKTRAWMSRYIEEVVSRYKDSPAIWMWEMGNEYSLHASLPNAAQNRPPVHPGRGTATTRSERDDLSFTDVRGIFTAFATEVRRLDPTRLIGSGDAMPRASAWHQHHRKSWKRDSPAQYAEMLEFVNPDPLGIISLHVYDSGRQAFAASMELARRINKPLFVGEFGAEGVTAEQAAEFHTLLASVEANGVPLAALWVFDFGHQPQFNITATNARSWQLDAIVEANARLRAEAGKH
jgi:hypothetical protein